MVLYVVARVPSMRTARNVFVVNLAVSDLMLCLITMPLTLIEILYLTWQFGNIEVSRKSFKKDKKVPFFLPKFPLGIISKAFSHFCHLFQKSQMGPFTFLGVYVTFCLNFIPLKAALDPKGGRTIGAIEMLLIC